MKRIILGILLLLPVITQAENYKLTELTLSKIRAVGNYEGSEFDNTVELWFTTSLSWPSGSGCTSTFRVYVDSTNSHIISAAYMAFASGKKVSINVDNTLPIRAGACEVSYFDIEG